MRKKPTGATKKVGAGTAGENARRQGSSDEIARRGSREAEALGMTLAMSCPHPLEDEQKLHFRDFSSLSARCRPLLCAL